MAGKPLFESMSDHYLSNPQVRDWLFQREPHTVSNTSMLDMAFSYACMYYPPPFVPKGDAPYPLPKPFLDLGDFLVCQRLHNGIALGTLFNQNENHALSSVRDSMLSSPKLSSRPRARRFAVDLRVKHLEIVEFAWMDDDSLIVACRRLQPSPESPETAMVLAADLLFFPVLPPDDTLTNPPLMRMTLSEKPAFCKFCGITGIKICKCLPSFKTRALPSPYKHHPASSSSSLISDDDDTYQLKDEHVLRVALQSWPEYAKSLFKLNDVGTFFCSWFVRSPDGKTLVPSYNPSHPIPYQFVTGSKSDTMRLTSVYVKQLQMAQRTFTADLRLKPAPQPDSVNSTITFPSSLHTDEQATLYPKQDKSPTWSASPSIDPIPEVVEAIQPKMIEAAKVSTRPSLMREMMSETDLLMKNENLKKFMKESVLDDLKCVPCNKKFSKRSNLVRHIETIHLRLKLFQCDTCRKKFGYRNHLRRHIGKLHTHSQTQRLHT